jgi:hypothetical protein
MAATVPLAMRRPPTTALVRPRTEGVIVSAIDRPQGDQRVWMAAMLATP